MTTNRIYNYKLYLFQYKIQKNRGRLKKILINVIKYDLIDFNIVSDITLHRIQCRDKIHVAKLK